MRAHTFEEASARETNTRRPSCGQHILDLRQSIPNLEEATFHEEEDAAHETALVRPRTEEDAVVASLLNDEVSASTVALEEESQNLPKELFSNLEKVQGLALAIHEHINDEDGAMPPLLKSGCQRRRTRWLDMFHMVCRITTKQKRGKLAVGTTAGGRRIRGFTVGWGPHWNDEWTIGVPSVSSCLVGGRGLDRNNEFDRHRLTYVLLLMGSVLFLLH